MRKLKTLFYHDKFVMSMLLVWLFNLNVIAQSPTSVSGVIANRWNHKGVSFANVILQNSSDSAFVDGGATNDEGVFSFDKISAGNYTISVSFLGFESSMSAPVDVTEGDVLVFDTLFIRRQKTQLEELNIVAERPMLEQSAGKTTLNVSEAMAGSGESALELMKYIPSASTDEEDNVLLRGAPATVMIDGVATDLQNALDAIPMGMIDKVEVITNPSAKYSSQNGSAIINIVLKTDKKKGANGRLNASFGLPEQYNVGGSFIFNHQRWTSFSNLMYKHFTDEVDAYSERTSLDTEIQTIQYGTGLTKSDKNRLNISQGIKYQMDKSSSLRMDFTYRLDDNVYNGYGDNKKYEVIDTTLKSYNTNVTDQDYERHYTSLALDYRKSFKDNSSLSIVGKFENQNKTTPYLRTVDYYNASTELPTGSYLEQNRTNPEQIRSWRLQTDYEKDLSDKLRWDAGFLFLQRRFDIESDYVKTKYNYDTNDDVYIIVTDSTQMYNYVVDELAPSMYTMLVFANDDWDLSAGLRYEYVNYNSSTKDTASSSTHHNVLPSLSVTRLFSTSFDLGFTVTSRTKMPSYKQLSPVVSYNGIYSKSIGNPSLEPERISSVELNAHNKFEKHNITSALFYKRFDNQIGRQEHYEIEDGNEILVKQFRNIGTVHQYGFDLNVSSRLPYSIRLKTNMLLLGQQILSEYQGSPMEVEGFSWSTKVVANQVLTDNFRWQITAGYSSPVKDINGERFAVFYSNIGVNQKVLDGKANIGFQVYDIFDTVSRERINDNSLKYHRYSYSKALTQKLVLSFSYKFNTMAGVDKKISHPNR